jgi:phosphatidylglycerophosphate synthase
MKKIIMVAAALVIAVAAQAQENYDPFNDRYFVGEFSKTLAILAVFTLVAVFLITIMKMLMDYRLRNKMIDKGVSEQLAAQMLQNNTTNKRNTALKWFLLMVSTGAGLMLIGLFRPYGIHSIAIIAFSIAAGFLGYYLFSKRSEQ